VIPIEKYGISGEINRLITDRHLLYKRNYKGIYRKLLTQYIVNRQNRDKDTYLPAMLFDKIFSSIHFRLKIINSSAIFSGICMPFIRKIFVDINGNISMCEKKYRIKEF
jgi:hypothetical protein